ncbi:hypothetical protein [Paenibacillus sp. sgz500992]|uniref:hypothetical protein n=1 Tax=Paenibacillus sp. sgz500992 TaxID=3242476 RepID=UPI0036D2F28B
MNQWITFNSKWGKALLLAAVIAVGSGVSGVGVSDVSAASPSVSKAVYKQFQKYVNKPSSLIQARKYLINHIAEAGVWDASLMTLQLENAQQAEYSLISEKIYPDNVQNAIQAADIKKGLTYTGLLSVIKDEKIRRVLIESRDKGYKIEASEGMYYPVIYYEGFKVFKPYINKDIAAYIDIMAAESNHPATYDAGITIPWEELISRAAIMADFADNYPGSNRIAVIRQELGYAVYRVFYGAENTPAYDFESNTLYPEVRKAYDDVLLDGTGNNKVLVILEQLLPMLDATGNKLTPEIEAFLKTALKALSASTL